ncbi:MAG: RNA-binding protein [Planctomyces sp.]|nr:RNA-binding protein [Planctomyces sp.]
MKLYVGNLSYQTTEQDLRSAFGRFGEVTSVSVITDRETGRSKGFAFVEMGSKDAGQQAISGLNETELSGRRITVNEARPREERPRNEYRGGGGGGGGGGSRGGGGGGGGRDRRW